MPWQSSHYKKKFVLSGEDECARDLTTLCRNMVKRGFKKLTVETHNGMNCTCNSIHGIQVEFLKNKLAQLKKRAIMMF